MCEVLNIIVKHRPVTSRESEQREESEVHESVS